MMRSPWAIFLFLPVTLGSFCGQNGVPFSLEVMPNGAPVLGCAQPTCIARPEDEMDDSVFETDNSGQVDGFFRDGDRAQNTILSANKYKANCSGQFDQLACVRKNEWVGGIEYIDHPRQPLILQCCSFEGLRFSQDVGVTTISAGEAVTGGEVIRDGRQISFDVIANVRKVVDSEDQTVSYEVTVRRMNCLPDPPDVEVQYEEDLDEEILRVLGTAGNMTLKKDHSDSMLNKYPSKSREIQESIIEPVVENVEIETTTTYRPITKKPIKKMRKKPFNEFAFGAPNYNPSESAPPVQKRHKIVQKRPQDEPQKVQPYPRTVPPQRPQQEPSTTAMPRSRNTMTTTEAPVTTSVFTPVTIGPSQYMQMGTANQVTPSPINQMGMGFPQMQPFPTLPPMSPFFNPFTLPPHQPFGLVTPAPLFSFPTHPLFSQQIPNLNQGQQYGVMNQNGFGHAQLSPLAQPGQVISIASPAYSPLSDLRFGQPFNPFGQPSQPLWPFGQPATGFSMMPQQVSPQIRQVDEAVNKPVVKGNVGESAEVVAPKIDSNGQIISNPNQFQPSQQALPNMFTPPPFTQLGPSLQNYNLG